MPATIVDKLLLLFIIPVVLVKTIFAAITGPFRGNEGAPTYGDHVINSLSRTALGLLRVEQTQWLLPSIVGAYKDWCTKNNIKPDVVDIPQTKAKGFWMGNKDTAKYTLIYYHGGGYVTPGISRHINLLANLLTWSNGDLAIFAVSYTLSPEARYPLAIGECVEGVRYILNLPDHTPANTVLGGDSAGGTLVLAVLSHISGHPHPQSNIVKPLQIDSNFKSAFLICPLTSIDKKYPSWTNHANRDNWPPSCGEYWLRLYLNGAPGDEYVYPALAKPEWWKNTKVSSLLVTCGEHEILRDAIVDLVERYRQGAGADKVKFVRGVKEVHIAPLVPMSERQLDELGPEKCQTATLRAWVKSL